MIAEIYEEGEWKGRYRIITDGGGTQKVAAATTLTVVDDDILNKEMESAPSITGQKKALFHPLLKSKRERLEELLDLFKTIKPHDYTKAEKDLIDNPFPIVWASVNLNPDSFSYGIRGEHLIKGKAELGQDLQVVFTNRKNVDKLQAQVKEHGVQVLSFEAAYFILGRDKETKYKSLWDWTSYED